MSYLIDTYGAPTHSELTASGCLGTTRYLSHDSGKNLTHAQVKEIHGLGKLLCPNFEDASTNARGGHGQGVSDATFARWELRTLNCPAGVCCYFSVDFEATTGELAAIGAYFRAARKIMRADGYLTGVYGSYKVVKYLLDNKLIDFGWQTTAWSYGSRDPRAVLYQDEYLGNRDIDVIEHGYIGAWTPTGAQKPLEWSDMATMAEIEKMMDARVAASEQKMRGQWRRDMRMIVHHALEFLTSGQNVGVWTRKSFAGLAAWSDSVRKTMSGAK